MSYFRKMLYLSASVIILTQASETLANPDIGSLYPTLTSHSLGLKPHNSFQVARATFLPDTKDDLGFSGRDTGSSEYNKGDECKDYTLSSCPSHGKCTKCPTNSNKQKLTGCDSGYSLSGNSCIKNFCSESGSYKNSIPENYVCTSVTRNPNCSALTLTNCDTCYQGCRKINCDGYPLNCSADTASLHIKSLEYCPDCKNKSASRCTTEKCKISECADGYKLNSAGTACVAKDDNCPSGYYKSCETGTQGEPKYTELGTACYQCKPQQTNAEKCESEGYHTMDYWNQQKPSNAAALQTPFQTFKNRFAYVFKDLVGIKSAQAATNLELQQGCPSSMQSSCKRNCTTQCQQFFCCGINAETGSDVIGPIQIETDCNTCDCSTLNCKSDCIKCQQAFDGNVSLKLNYEFQVSATCPYDSNYVKGEWVIKRLSLSAEVGDILYSDLTTGKPENYASSGKTAIGVVFDPDKKLAIALDTEQKSWSTTYFDISGLPNQSDATGDLDGKNNTKTIVNYCKTNSKSCPAAEYAYAYSTAGTNAGDWYLPALGELNLIYPQRSILNTTLNIIGSNTDQVNTYYHWSSSEYDKTYAWGQYFSGGSNYYNYSNGTKAQQSTFYVRPVINYGDTNNCSVENCKECESGSSTSCKTCNDGYMLNLTTKTCTKQLEIDTPSTQCNGKLLTCSNRTYCCPSSTGITSCSQINSGSPIQCLMMTSYEGAICNGTSVTCNGASYCCSGSMSTSFYCSNPTLYCTLN